MSASNVVAFPTGLEPESPAPIDIAKLKIEFGARTPTGLDHRVRELGATEFVVEGLIPRRSLNLLAGSSGAGKTPLTYQLAVAVAAGVPFLGFPTRRGRVVMLDFENGIADLRTTILRVTKHLQLDAPPEDLFVWSASDSPSNWGSGNRNEFELIREARPDLVVIDPLSALDPEAEAGSTEAMRFYRKLRKIIKEVGCSVLLVHHPRKAQEKGKADFTLPSLEESTSAREWFSRVRGSGVLISGVDGRFAFDSSTSREGGLVLGGYGRIRGDLPLIHLGRVFDNESGEPLGYERLAGVDLLESSEHQEIYRKLPDTFRFADAKGLYGRGPQATTGMLQKLTDAALIRKLPGRSGYQKT